MKLLAIDGNSVLNRAFYGVKPLTNKDGVHTNAIFGFLNILNKLEREIAPDAIAIAFDVSRKTFRNEQYDQYKATRKGMPEDLAEQLPLIKEILTLMGYTILGVEGYEGDDILGTLSAKCGCECVVATGDRDCLQLINDNVSVCLLKNAGNMIYTEQTVLDEYSILPNQIVDLKALMGDSSDNIPGVKGVGEKTAINLIVNHHTIEEIYNDIDSVIATPRVKELLRQGKENAFLSFTLATICKEVPIDTDPDIYVKKAILTDELSQLFTKLELFSFLKKLNLKETSNVIVNKEKKTVQETEAMLDVIENVTVEQVIDAVGDDNNIYTIYDQDVVYINIAGKIYCCNEVDSLIKVVAITNKKLITYKSKTLIKKIKSLGFDNVNIEFDLEICAYLLNPDTKVYDIEGLIDRYIPEVSFSECEKHTAIRALPYLHKTMLKTLDGEGMKKLFDEIELPLVEVLADMETEGIMVDSTALDEFGKMLTVNIETLKQAIFDLAGEEFNINSTAALATILFDKLGLPAKKKTKTGYSTNADVLDELYDKHEIIPAILEYRQLAKLSSTYVVGLSKMIGEQSRIHTTFNQTETRTGRISSVEPNLQNIPVRTKLGREMRKFFIAREGYTLIDADYSQIELRLLAHIADDKNMINAFKSGADIHSNTASQVFNCPMEEMTPTIRSRAKAINFGIVYGISPFSLSKDINVSVGEAKEYIGAYMKTYSGVADYMHNVVEQAKVDEYVTTLYGRKRYLTDINNKNKMIAAFASRVALNAPIQGTAADIIKLAMVRVHRRLKKEGLDARLILQVHDELIIEAAVFQAAMVKKLLKEEMENAVTLAVALTVDVNEGNNWYIAKG